MRWYLPFFAFIFLSSFLPNAEAVKIDIQVERTPQAPGFLSFTIFPPAQAPLIPLEEVYIQNYKDSEKELYEKLMEMIQELGGRVIAPTEAPFYYKKPFTRVISLGNAFPLEANGWFIPSDSEKSLEEFVEFSSQNLRSVRLQNLKLVDPQENIFNIVPSQIDFLADEPITFFGEFKEEVPSKLLLGALGKEEPLQAEIEVDIKNISLLNTSIPEAWESARKASNIPNPKAEWLFSLFPWMLAIGGILSLIGAARIKTPKNLHQQLPHYLKSLEAHTAKDPLPFDFKKHETHQRHIDHKN